jgi:hypothetical protein
MKIISMKNKDQKVERSKEGKAKAVSNVSKAVTDVAKAGLAVIGLAVAIITLPKKL